MGVEIRRRTRCGVKLFAPALSSTIDQSLFTVLRGYQELRHAMRAID
ncbi:hypothetical protein [Burkholderia ambifaria]|nr:hypothetical protein [Burkholderia ambifaria]